MQVMDRFRDALVIVAGMGVLYLAQRWAVRGIAWAWFTIVPASGWRSLYVPLILVMSSAHALVTFFVCFGLALLLRELSPVPGFIAFAGGTFIVSVVSLLLWTFPPSEPVGMLYIGTVVSCIITAASMFVSVIASKRFKRRRASNSERLSVRRSAH